MLGSMIVAMGLLAGGVRIDATAQNKASDQALKDRIERRLETDPLVRKYDVRVKVDEGDVKLEGTVATDSQKAEAARLARLAGVDDVDNEISVDKDADQVLANRASKGLRRNGDAVSDAWITHKVQWFFVGESSLDGSKIEVETKDRVVTLDGKVRTAEARARANDLANYVDGVLKVVDKLEIDRD
jgi:hyperosmotically inducible protein